MIQAALKSENRESREIGNVICRSPSIAPVRESYLITQEHSPIYSLSSPPSLLSLFLSRQYRERENFSYVCVSASFRARYFHVVACMEDFSRVKYFSGSRGWERETVSPRSGYFLRLHSSYRGKEGGRRRKI